MKNNNFSFSFSELKLEEFKQFANDITKVIKKHELDNTSLTGVLNLFEAEATLVDKISRESRKHPLSTGIEQLRTERNKKVTTILALMRAYRISPDSLAKPAAELALPILEVHLNDFAKLNGFIKNQRMQMLRTKISSDADFANALQVLGIRKITDELQFIEADLNTMVEERRATKPDKPETNAGETVTKASDLLRKLLSTIEVNALVDTQNDYKPLIAELDATISEYRKLIAGRRMHKKQLTVKNATTPVAVTTGAVKSEAITAPIANSL